MRDASGDKRRRSYSKRGEAEALAPAWRLSPGHARAPGDRGDERGKRGKSPGNLTPAFAQAQRPRSMLKEPVVHPSAHLPSRIALTRLSRELARIARRHLPL
jgi:hypothetical protein